MKKSSCGINGDGVLRGLRRSMVVFIGPWWCSLVHGDVHWSMVVFIGPWWCSSVHSGVHRSMVVFIGPCSCVLWRICKAYAEVGLLFLMDLVCSW